MGGVPYRYVFETKDDVTQALQALRAREFAAGRFNPSMPMHMGTHGQDFFQKTARHGFASIAEAREAADADGTRSILDIGKVGPQRDYGVAGLLDDEALDRLFDTTKPTAAMIDESDVLEDIERGMAVAFAVYDEAGARIGWAFCGYSYD